MAEGRMLVKTISYDARIAGLSVMARMLWPYIIPHAETNASLPRNARQLRLMCFPDWKDITDQDVESAILEWLATRPGIVRDSDVRGQKKLILADFESCNWDLDFIKKRRKRKDKSKMSQVSGTNRNVQNVPLEVKGSEEKRSEENKTTDKLKKEIIASLPPSADSDGGNSGVEKETEASRGVGAIRIVVAAYKKARGIGVNDKAWDRANFSTYCRAAKKLLEAFNGDDKAAVVYLFKKADDWDGAISWNLATVAKHAWDDRGNHGGGSGGDVRGQLGHGLDAGKVGPDRILDDKRRSGIAHAGEVVGETLKNLRPGSLLGGPRQPQSGPNPLLAKERDGEREVG